MTYMANQVFKQPFLPAPRKTMIPVRTIIQNPDQSTLNWTPEHNSSK